MKTPLVSVVIPTYNEEKDISNCLESLQKQNYPKNKIDIIIVDDGSTDKTINIVNQFSKVKLIKGEHKGPGISRNLGAEKARGEILIFVDADMTFDKDYVKELIKPILEGKEIATEDGIQIASNPENIWSKCWGQYFKSDPNKIYGGTTRAIKRLDFLRLGGFDPSLGYMDDKTLLIKHGIKALWVRSAICYHKNPETLKEVYKQSVWIGSSILHKWINVPILNFIIACFISIAFPLAIIPLSIRKCYKNDNFRVLFPYMLIFIAVRYLGTVKGIFRRILFNKNIR